MTLYSQHRLAPTPQLVGELLAGYGLALRRFEAAGTGMENTTLLASCAEGEYVVRIYRREKRGEADVRREVAFLQHLIAQGIPVPRFVARADGEVLAELTADGGAWRALVMERVAGHHAAAYAPALLEDLARTQARLHLAAESFGTLHPALDLGPPLRELRETQFLPHIDREALAEPRLSGFLDRAGHYHLVLDERLPRGLCHLDYDKENALASADGRLAAVLDFDDLALAPYVVDLAYTAWHVLAYEGEAASARYVAAYEALRPLSDAERAWLYPAMLFRHYVIGSLGILEGETAEPDIAQYLALEALLGGDATAAAASPRAPSGTDP